MAPPSEDQELIALVEGIDAIEARLDGLRPSMLGILGRVGTYFGVLIALTVGLVDTAYLFPWMAAALLVACIPDLRRYWRYRALAKRRDLMIERGAVLPLEGSDDGSK